MTGKQLTATLNFLFVVIVLMGGGAWLQSNLKQVGLENLLVEIMPAPTVVPSVTPQVLSQHIEPAQVARVIDGDTIELSTGQKVRYIGIDTPETVHPQKAVQCFGKAGSAENKRLVENQTVYLVKDVSETDRYGRLLRYVYLSPEASASGMVNAQLVMGGFAKASSYPPDIAQQKEFQKLENEARLAARGLWSSECQAP